MNYSLTKTDSGYGDMPLFSLLVDQHSGSGKRKLSEEDLERMIFGQVVSKGTAPKLSVLPTAGMANYRISDNNLGSGSLKDKFKRNVLAIHTLKQLETTGRSATKEEQDILAQYVGWGGLSQAFDAHNTKWKNEYKTMRKILSQTEYQSAQESVLTAFYTPPVVIDAIYYAITRLGFSVGNLLEPALGVGNFFGRLPDALSGMRLYGAEPDSISSRIARQLYQSATVFNGGFEVLPFPDHFFDLAISNVPFGNFKIFDKDPKRNHFLIHDYFFIRALDKLRPGGVLAFITSKGTMEKADRSVREYICQHAELLGAIRLPNSVFKDQAGTVVTTDVLFLKKRDYLSPSADPWVHISMDPAGLPLNQYFVDNPHMILGDWVEISSQFGPDTACIAPKGFSLQSEIKKAIDTFTFDICPSVLPVDDVIDFTGVPADPSIHNFAYGVIDEIVYFRENSLMFKADASGKALDRIKGMITVRDSVRELLTLQLNDASDLQIEDGQNNLTLVYDQFVAAFGRINATSNQRAFSKDDSYWLLCSLEVFDEHNKFARKADIFTKRTIAKHIPVSHVDNAQDALTLSISEKGVIDFEYMEQLTDSDQDSIIEQLVGCIFLNPVTNIWETADAYLSGNIRTKLSIAELAAQRNPDFVVNVDALREVMPERLDASDIEVRLGATWVDASYIRDFIREVLQPASWLLDDGHIDVSYIPQTGSWSINGINADSGSNVFAFATYGTTRANGYRLLEASLNMKDIRIFDTIYHGDGSKQSILNHKETIIAQQKQDALKERFREWIFEDAIRREALVNLYNERFNSFRSREFDGRRLVLHGITPDISLRDYQLNAITRAIHGGNTLIAHAVGAGKTFEMTAIAMESIFLGIAKKCFFVVPNHLIGQWSREFLQLYPGANLLIARKKDFEKNNRKKFCSRIATGNYDAIVIGHSQFLRIPLSQERQIDFIQQEIDALIEGIAEAKREDGEHFTIKDMVRVKKSLEVKLESLLNSPKDGAVCFEELGIDRLFVDEAHEFKNLFLKTKMRNVAGLSVSDSQKAMDLFFKCRYMNELTDNKGVIFATGTPLSNSMTELYTMMRYLAYDQLVDLGIEHFDAWASIFAEQVTTTELSPEGKNYRLRTRLARFFNLPELLRLFKNFTDVCTADQLSLPIPVAIHENITLSPSPEQQAMLDDLVARAEQIRSGGVDASVDNMLKVTTDGKRLALDQRLMDNSLMESDTSKASTCASQIFDQWQASTSFLGTQLVFCDLSVPGKDGFNVYDCLKGHLVNLGIPDSEVAFIHDANTDTRKDDLFHRVRIGDVRVLIGSTAKMGCGTNIQNRLVALHHLDVPWRPADLEQREGRILRQGNMNQNVTIYRYITSESFDAYSWQIIENKQRFIGQVMTSRSPLRASDNVDDQALTYAEIKSLACGSPLIKEKIDLDIQMMKLREIKSNYDRQRYRLEDQISHALPQQILLKKDKLNKAVADKLLLEQQTTDVFSIVVNGARFSESTKAHHALLLQCDILKGEPFKKEFYIGNYCGFDLFIYRVNNAIICLLARNQLSYEIDLNRKANDNFERMNVLLNSCNQIILDSTQAIELLTERLASAKDEVVKPFEFKSQMEAVLNRLSELNAILSVDTKVISSSDDSVAAA